MKSEIFGRTMEDPISKVLCIYFFSLFTCVSGLFWLLSWLRWNPGSGPTRCYRCSNQTSSRSVHMLTLLLLIAKMRAHPSVSMLHPATEKTDNYHPGQTLLILLDWFGWHVTDDVMCAAAAAAPVCWPACRATEQIDGKIIRREVQSMEMCLIKAICVSPTATSNV